MITCDDHDLSRIKRTYIHSILTIVAIERNMNGRPNSLVCHLISEAHHEWEKRRT